jgi:hypothetical protein
MSTPVSIDEKTTRDATDLLTVTTQAGVSYKIQNQNFVQNLPTQENPFDIGALTEISALADGDFFPVRDATDGQDKKISKANLENEIGGGGGGGSVPYVLLRDVKTQGTAGGSFTSGAKRIRDLNEKTVDTDSICTLSGNQFALPEGTYRFFISAPAFYCGVHRVSLYNVTLTATVLLGSSEYAYAGTVMAGRSFLSGRVAVTEATTFEVQHQCSTSRSPDGFGVACSFGEDEIYTICEIWKED